jgi:hypothetical protein
MNPRFLDLSIVAGEWSASRHGCFTPWERAHGTHWIGGWVGPRAGLDDMEKWKFLTLTGIELRHVGRPARTQSLYRLRCRGSSSLPIWINISVTYSRVACTRLQGLTVPSSNIKPCHVFLSADSLKLAWEHAHHMFQPGFLPFLYLFVHLGAPLRLLLAVHTASNRLEAPQSHGCAMIISFLVLLPKFVCCSTQIHCEFLKFVI